MPQDVALIVSVLLAVVGFVGIIIPVLPGSVTIIVGLLVWAVFGSSSWGWVACAVGSILLVVGMLSGLLITQRSLDARGIPQWPLRVSVLVGVAAGFVLPAFGLVIGFVVTLLLCEWLRVRRVKEAVSTSWLALRSVGAGILIELMMASLACSLLAASIFTSRV